MQSHIFAALEKLGLSPQKRAIHVQFSNPALNTQVFLQRIDGEHLINQGLSAELICLSTDALIPLKNFLGAQVAVDQVSDRGQLIRTTGIITEAVQGQSDGSLTLYKLRVQDATSLWHKRRNSRVFMNKSVPDVVQLLFKEWQQKSPLFATALSLDTSGLQREYDVRPFMMQSNETDYDFLTRLLRSEGINWLIDETQNRVMHASESIQPQKLRLIDDNSQYSALARRSIRFHRSSATEQQDSITSFIAQRSLQPTAVHVQRWQADSLSQEEGAGSVQSSHQHSDNQDNASLGLEQAWHASPAWMQDLNGEDGATASGGSQIERLNQQLNQYHALQAKQFSAQSTVRDTHVGYWFELQEHPEIDQHSGADAEFLIVGKSFYNQNNLPKDLNTQVNQLIQQSQWSIKNLADEDERQANTLSLQRRNIAFVPEYHIEQHRPNAYAQRAKVVGPAGEEIHVDEWGRIKVRFLFTRSDDHSHDGGAGSNDTDTDSAWVDVLTPWAGEGYGARFLPRIDEIVVIDFFDGNIDRPFVVGRIHEGARNPTKFDNKGQLPDTKKIAGIRSKEVAGQGFGQLRFDDTTGQISTQLQSSHGAAQLNLGKLSHPKDKESSADRGEGFELRTDQWGAVRAGQGLLVSTYKQDQAKGEHVDAEVAKKQLESSHSNSKALSDIAKQQKTDEIESLEQLKAFAENIEQDIAKFKKAILLLNAVDGIALSTPEDIHLSATGMINQVAADSISLSSQKNIVGQALGKVSLFAAQGGIKAIAAQSKIEIQAQADALDILAKKGIVISSTEDKIEISSPKEIVITGASSQITLNGSGILAKTGGKFEVNAGQHVFKPASSVSTSAQLPASNPMKGALELLKSYGGKDFFSGTGFKVIDALGKQVAGKLDGNGFAQVTGIAPGPAKVEFDKDPRSAWDQASHFKRDYQWAEKVVPGASDLIQNALGSLGKNLTSQLKDNLFNLNADTLKNIGKNALKDLGDQALGQYKDQVKNTALSAISSKLNLGLSAEQMANLGQSAKGLSNGLSGFGLNNGIVSDSSAATMKNATPTVDANLVGREKSYSSSALTYTETIRERPIAEVLASTQPKAQPKPAEVVPIVAKKPEAPVQPAPVDVSDEDWVARKQYSSRYLSYSETTRQTKNNG
ncbi:type VI secretion system tip protein VgrG [Acinetobacter cumulans]|uniref:Type VI secretion system tip protein VgrG n=1 Tax=Acinetobacter cumulans TaxID=2136182 RepID=A0A3A8G4G1_9GAMM|nr:type VI secretion system Vgr family protein [Acinetobacter cumulans]RKG54032.1 type VI secretion system tip protein VgrG [Acinetobacter cumulans]